LVNSLVCKGCTDLILLDTLSFDFDSTKVSVIYLICKF
jgi:hypothetical protein